MGAIAGLALGLAVGPTGAALLGFRFPYLKLSLGESRAAADPAPPPGPAPARTHAAVVPLAPLPVKAAVQLQPLAVPAGRTLSIGVFGDSMADGLWAALYHDFRKSGAVEVFRFAQNSTGLTRYDYVDVQAQTRDQLAEHHVDVAVVMFGTNDGQGIVADDGKVYAFGTPAWRQAYEARIDALVKLLRSQGAAVYWVGLPKMEKEEMDRRASLLNGIFEARMAALGAPFIPTVAQTVDEQGRYDAYLASPGEAHKRLMRAPDGIHMTMAGYGRLALPVAARLHDDLAARIQSAAAQLAPSQPLPSQPAPRQPATSRPAPIQPAPIQLAPGPAAPPSPSVARPAATNAAVARPAAGYGGVERPARANAAVMNEFSLAPVGPVETAERP